MTTALRPMTLGELLDRTFQLYRRHFLVFVGIAALPHLVVLVFQLFDVAFHPLAVRGFRFSSSGFLWTLGSLVLTLIVSTMAQAATVIGVSQFHLDRPLSISQAFGAVQGRLVSLCIIAITTGLLIGAGTLLLIIPGLLLALRWALVIPVAVLEHSGVSEARSRSADLTDGSRGRVFVVYILFFLLNMIVSSVWQIPVFIATFTAAAAGHLPIAMPGWTRVLVVVGAFFTQSLVVPVLTIAMSLIYYDERVKKEGFDLETMMNQLDTPAAGAPATA